MRSFNILIGALSSVTPRSLKSFTTLSNRSMDNFALAERAAWRSVSPNLSTFSLNTGIILVPPNARTFSSLCLLCCGNSNLPPLFVWKKTPPRFLIGQDFLAPSDNSNRDNLEVTFFFGSDWNCLKGTIKGLFAGGIFPVEAFLILAEILVVVDFILLLFLFFTIIVILLFSFFLTSFYSVTAPAAKMYFVSY